MNKAKLGFGLDCWVVSCSMPLFFALAAKNKIELFEVSQTKDGILFYTPVFLRSKVKHTFNQGEYQYTTGALGFVLKQLQEPIKICCVFFSIGLWLLYSHCIFMIEVVGPNHEIKVKIEEVIKGLGYEPPFLNKNMLTSTQLEMKIKSALEDDLAWIEVVKEGSQFKIQFVAKQYVETKAIGNTPIYANKDALIAYFEIQHGFKKVEVNQFVSKGTLLVDNSLADAFDQVKDLKVKGRVFGYTWYTIESELAMSAPNKLEIPFIFLRMLMDCRLQISREIQVDEKIIKENILHFTSSAGKIRMKVHYTLLEDIGRLEEETR